MEGNNLLQKIISSYSKKIGDLEISYEKLLAFINNLVINDESGRYDIFSTNTSDVLTAKLIDLEQKGSISLTYSGTKIKKIYNYGYIIQSVRTAYQIMESNSEYPFPTESSLGINIPEDKITSLRLPDSFAKALEDNSNDKIFKLFMSGELSPVIAEGETLKDRALVLAVNKFRNHIAHKNNANYIYHKMVPAFRKNTRSLVDTIKMVQSNPGRAAMAIEKPDEFLFAFWTQLCSIVKKELLDKENKTTHDEGLLQASYLVNAYVMHYKDIIISIKRKEEALNSVVEKLKEEPYNFTISDIYAFADKNGAMLNKKYNKDDLHKFIKSKIKTKDKEILPELIKIKTVNNKIYYIHRNVFLNLVRKKINEAHDYYRKEYIDRWSDEMKNYKAPSEMNNDDVFQNNLEKKIKKEDPLLYAILGYEILSLAMDDTKNIKLKAVAQGWVDSKREATKPLPLILGLRRRDLVAEVRSIVPFWLTIGFFRKFAAIFGWNRRKRKKKTVSNNMYIDTAVETMRSTASQVEEPVSNQSVNKSKSTEYKRSLEYLKNQYNYSTHTIHDSLDELVNQWNPLLDSDARNNLVKDVNNMVRDYIRKILRETAFAVPDKERVANIAELLAGNKAFNIIKKRESFINYIEIYIVKILTETKP